MLLGAHPTGAEHHDHIVRNELSEGGLGYEPTGWKVNQI
jgi:hypothetical protein